MLVCLNRILREQEEAGVKARTLRWQSGAASTGNAANAALVKQQGLDKVKLS